MDGPGVGTLPGRGAWGWQVSWGDAASFHARDVPDDVGPVLWVHHVDRPAVVLGSTQPEAVVDRTRADRLGIEVARRRSGGGLVLVHPDHARWVDVIVPRAHPAWCDDVGRAFHWLGEAWGGAIRTLLPTAEASTVGHHQGPLITNRWSPLVCFAGLGPGEVVVGGSKVVGISQRRTRAWARFQCLVVGAPDLDLLAEVVSPAALPGPRCELEALPVGAVLDPEAALRTFAATLGIADGPIATGEPRHGEPGSRQPGSGQVETGQLTTGRLATEQLTAGQRDDGRPVGVPAPK